MGPTFFKCFLFVKTTEPQVHFVMIIHPRMATASLLFTTTKYPSCVFLFPTISLYWHRLPSPAVTPPDFSYFTLASESEIHKILSNCPNKQSESEALPFIQTNLTQALLTYRIVFSRCFLGWPQMFLILNSSKAELLLIGLRKTTCWDTQFLVR